MAFDFYFTGVPSGGEVADFLLQKNACILLSQLNERPNIYRWIDRIKSSESKCKLFIDSGAFSAWTKGKSIDIDEYIDFINKYKDYLYICASVDNIPGKPRTSHVASEEEVNKSAEKTWENFLYMRSKMEDVDKLLCTFHCGESWEYLEEILSYKDEHGPIHYMAFGGLVGKSEAVISAFLEKAFSIIKNSNNPNIKVHAFGMTRINYLESYPFFSADSTSWLQSAGYGFIVVKSKTICISDRQILSNEHLLNKTPVWKEEVESLASKYGLTLEELIESPSKRLIFNVKSLQDWAENYNHTFDSITYKPELF